MQEQLKVAIIQSDLVWENPEQNRINFTKKIKEIKQPVDVIVLPEMFTSGFTMNPEHVFETMNGTTLAWMIETSKKTDSAICGSLVISENNNFYNRFVFVTPNGHIEQYDKRHTFTLAGEHKVYKAGNKRLTINYKGWKILPQVCYDLRFPVWARNTEDFDVLIYAANWPKVRTIAWDTLLQARAIENMAYCVGVNRVGFDGNDHEYIGHSVVYDVLGKQISTADFETEFTETIVLEKEHIESNRKHLQFLNDRDSFTLT